MKAGRAKQANKVRVIAGQFRGRVVSFIDYDSLRPTPDRVRETLFNWLQFDIVDSKCLDLFSGSGVLAIEAASRGAQQVLAVEKAVPVVAEIERQLGLIGADVVTVTRQSVLDFLQVRGQEKYNIVFIDPPYDLPILNQVFEYLTRYDWLEKNAKIYFEANYELLEDDLPQQWKIIKAKKAGQVNYYLAQYFLDE